jgi:hypothetical protein
MTVFSGSFLASDVTLLLKPIRLDPMAIDDREREIQSGRRHYSEMIGPEDPPPAAHLAVFHQALDRNLGRLARDCLNLAAQIAASRPGPLVLVSIARSGLPIGVIVARILRSLLGRPTRHYGISVIRDRGLDMNAAAFILARHGPETVIFLDGWTGKGVIARELAKSVFGASSAPARLLDPGLAVLSDLAGLSAMAAGTDDYLIPTCLLNSVVSGLISRTILTADLIGPGDFHGCLLYSHLAPWDLSLAVVDRVMDRALAEAAQNPELLNPRPAPPGDKARAAASSRAFMERAMAEFGVSDENLIKPGLGEATRVLLRRAPRVVMVRDRSDPDVGHVLALARERGVDVRTVPDLFYRAAAVIRVVTG